MNGDRKKRVALFQTLCVNKIKAKCLWNGKYLPLYLLQFS